MMRLVDTDRVAVSGSAAERAWRPGGVHGARLWVLVCVVAWLVAALPASARAADVVYWANGGNNTISFARLDGSGGGDLPTTGATVAGPRGVALDPAAGRIYWANTGNNTISFASLDGSGGGGDLAITGATLTKPIGVALDPAAGRIYWTNDDPTGNQLSFARLDGSGGGDLPTTGATVDGPRGVALDLGAGRIYWANNNNAGAISFARLDGSGGGGNLATAGATVSLPSGVALDPAAGRIYWDNLFSGISFANLDGSGGGGGLATTGATLNQPIGVALDPAAGRIYWANNVGGKISFARLDGSGGGDLATGGATVSSPFFPALLERPGGAGAPVVSGGSAAGAALSCSTGGWAPDLVGAFLYRAPRSFAYAWSRDGAPVAGAATSSLTASAPGAYRCQVTATNQAGSATQTSAPHSVAAAPAPALTAPAPPPRAAAFGARTLVSLGLAARRIAARGPLPVRVANGNGFAVAGALSGQTTGKAVSRRKPVKLKARSFSLTARARKTIKLALPRQLRRPLRREGKLSLRLAAKVTDSAGNTRTVTKLVTPKLKRKRGS